MSIVFEHDGHTYWLHTETGEAKVDQIDREPADPPPLEPSDEVLP